MILSEIRGYDEPKRRLLGTVVEVERK